MAEGSSETKNKTLSAVANTLLLASAGWGLQVASDRPFVGTAFGIYALKGLCGVLNKVTDDENVKKLGDEVDSIAFHFGVPLVAAEMTKYDCVPILPTVSEYFIVPLLNYFSRFLEIDIDPKILAASQGFSLGSTGACVIRKNPDPGQVAFVHAFLGSVGAEGNVPEEVNTLILAIACLLTWATITGRMPNLVY